jgi:hypothetical protein
MPVDSNNRTGVMGNQDHSVATTWTRNKILETLKDNAEEPEDITEGKGTFKTFRVEYLINDIESAISSAVRARDEEFTTDLARASTLFTDPLADEIFKRLIAKYTSLTKSLSE